jgi:glyoxylase-like metal-dependent hydrolase (beta-lactamase superfamily II)
MEPSARRIEAGVHHLQNEAWETSSVLVLRGGCALVCGPGFTEALIGAARRGEGQRERVGATQLLVTHVDFDHLQGVFGLPEARVVAGRATARLLEEDATREKLRRLAGEWGASWPRDPCVDRVVEAGEVFTLGVFTVRALAAEGHTPDGLAYVLSDLELLLPGDYISASSYPFLTASLSGAIGTYERLLAELACSPIRWVVPGHGPFLDRGEATRIAREDLDYLQALEGAARAAAAGGMSPGQALVRAYAVEPPRANLPDFEVFAPRLCNARIALGEAREALREPA